MTLEDPFFVVKDEVFKALKKTRTLYVRWCELQDDCACLAREEAEWTNTELKNSLRSIEWDLEDLEDAIDIVEKNPTKFTIDNKELTVRKNFIDCTRKEVKSMKDTMSSNKNRYQDQSRQILLENSPVRVSNSHRSTKYSKLENNLDSPQHFLAETLAKQQTMTRQQKEHLQAIGDSIGSLKNISRHISMELDEQAVMLDEFGTEMERSESKLDSSLKKLSKVLHLSNDRCQWIAIIVLSIVLLIVIFLFLM